MSTLSNLSFELFPPKAVPAIDQLIRSCDQLKLFEPDYYSVTFGAAGANQDKSLLVINRLIEKNYTVAPHLTGIGLKKEQIKTLLDYYQKNKIKNLVVIRGDLPTDQSKNIGDFSYAYELVSFIREQFGDYFKIKVGAYPEFHPQIESANADFKHFQNKVLMGADSAITQFFFNVDAYYHFRNLCEQANINIPIIPGIMPIMNFPRLCHFANLCGAEIPRWLKKTIEAYQEDHSSILQFGINFITEMCQKLIEYGVPGLHFYTLNNVEPTKTILIGLGLTPKNNVEKYELRSKESPQVS